MNVVSIIQARTSSTRLPRKILLDIAGKPMLWHVISRAQRADTGPVVVATSDDTSDDPVVAWCHSSGFPCFRGSLGDLIDRYTCAAREQKADAVVRLTGDCPLLDPAVVRRVVDLYRSGSYDYVSNVHPPTFPDGLDTEAFSMASLERAHHEARLPSEREHIAPYFEKHPDLFRLGNLAHTENLSHLRWTVDEPRDLAFVRAVFTRMGSDMFGMEDVLALLEKEPELQRMNEGIVRNAGHASALKADAEFLKKQ